MESKTLTITYSFAESPFGSVLVASTIKGIVYLAFAEKKNGFADLKKRFPHATLTEKSNPLHTRALRGFSHVSKVPLDLHGTEFQLKVWNALQTIKPGTLSTYDAIAKHIKRPMAHRAVGTAIGKNPIAFLVPCHRVIRSDGAYGNYHWGAKRKSAMILSESSRILNEVA